MRGPEIRKTHPYHPDPTIADYAGRRPCTCGFPKGWRGHEDPEIDPEAAVIDARILGETEEERTEEKE